MKLYHLLGKEPYFANHYILSDEKGSCILIDCCIDVKKVKKALKNEKAQLKGILLTHGHHDHIDSIKDFKEEFKDLEVYISKEDAEHFNVEGVSYYEGDEVSIDGITLQIIKTPGHTPGGVCLLCADNLFTGDTLFAGTVGRTDFKGGDYDVLMNSLKLIIETVQEDTRVYPGHNHFSTLKIEKEQNPYLKNIIREL